MGQIPPPMPRVPPMPVEVKAKAQAVPSPEIADVKREAEARESGVSRAMAERELDDYLKAARK